MQQQTVQLLCALLKSAVSGKELSEEEKRVYSDFGGNELWSLAEKNELSHLVSWAITQNKLSVSEGIDLQRPWLKAVFQNERMLLDYQSVCQALEKARIPFLPLKGSVLRGYYPESWMRTSCDVDILVHREHLEAAIACLVQDLQFVEKGRGSHDVSLFSPMDVHVELHFDLIEEERVNNAFFILEEVWQHAAPRPGSDYFYRMTDAFFYLYHLVHMAKHIETGGCGVRPFLDLWILDRLETADLAGRDALLERCGLSTFTRVCRQLSRAWFEAEPMEEASRQLQEYLLRGGVYGTSANRVALAQKKKGGRLGYLWSRMFISYDKLKRYYPILEKHRWLMPFMQIRRWFMLLDPGVAKMAKSEMAANSRLQADRAGEMEELLKNIGLS